MGGAGLGGVPLAQQAPWTQRTPRVLVVTAVPQGEDGPAMQARAAKWTPCAPELAGPVPTPREARLSGQAVIKCLDSPCPLPRALVPLTGATSRQTWDSAWCVTCVSCPARGVLTVGDPRTLASRCQTWMGPMALP